MGFQTKKDRNVIGDAIKGAGEGIVQGVDLQAKLENANTQRGFMQNQLLELKQKQQEQQQKVQQAARGAILTEISNGIQSNDPKTYMKNKSADWQGLIDHSGLQMDLNQVQQWANVSGEEYSNASKTVNAAKGFLVTAQPGTVTPEQVKTNYENGINGFNTMLSNPNVSKDAKAPVIKLRDDFIAQNKNLYDKTFQMNQKALDRQNDLAKEGAKPDLIAKDDVKSWSKDYNDTSNPRQGTFTGQTIGGAVRRLNTGGDALRVIDQIKGANGQKPIAATKTVVTELSGSLASMMLANNVGIEAMKEFTPDTSYGTVQAFIAKALSDPRDTINKKFLDQLQAQIGGQMGYWAQNLQEHVQGSQVRYGSQDESGSFYQQHPEKKKQFDKMFQTTYPRLSEYVQKWGNTQQPNTGSGQQTGQATSSQQQPAPHGQTVQQNGTTFVWNGTQYVPQQ